MVQYRGFRSAGRLMAAKRAYEIMYATIGGEGGWRGDRWPTLRSGCVTVSRSLEADRLATNLLQAPGAHTTCCQGACHTLPLFASTRLAIASFDFTHLSRPSAFDRSPSPAEFPCGAFRGF